jgi:hypothetical protein
MNLKISLKEIPNQSSIEALSPTWAALPWICERCRDAQESVVVALQVAGLDKNWALCRRCAAELPYQLRCLLINHLSN